MVNMESKRGRKGGYHNISLEQIRTIVEMTEEGCFRGKIAELADVSKDTVYKYQKRFDLV